jgi:hypothetical protein
MVPEASGDWLRFEISPPAQGDAGMNLKYAPPGVPVPGRCSSP